MKGGTLLVVDDALAVDGVLVVGDASGGCSCQYCLYGPLEPLHITVGAERWLQWVTSWHRKGRGDGEARRETQLPSMSQDRSQDILLHVA